MRMLDEDESLGCDEESTGRRGPDLVGSGSISLRRLVMVGSFLLFICFCFCFLFLSEGD